MGLELLLFWIGWIFATLPFLAFVCISVAMVVGVSKEDGTVKALALFGLSMTIVGVVLLILVYNADLIGRI